MGKGTPRYTFRIPAEMMRQVEEQILSRNAWTADEPWDTSEFVRVAIKEKLAKMRRSRGERKDRGAAAQLQEG